MRRRVQALVVGTVALAFGAAGAPASAATVPDASCSFPTGATIVQANGNLKVAQSFTAQHTGALVTAQMTLTNPPGSTPGDWRYEIAPADGTGLPGAVLAATTVTNTLGNGVEGTVTGTFTSPAHVNAGASYALLVSRPGSNGYRVSDQGGDKCPGQAASYQNAVAGPFILYPFVDYAFATTVDVSTGATTKCKKKKKHGKTNHLVKKHKKCKKKKGKR